MDHANTNNLLSEIQRELNEANKKISRLRNEVDVRIYNLFSLILSTKRMLFNSVVRGYKRTNLLWSIRQ